jgi:sigma-B regulation protein RsbU (phosphoserine phosphatase)
VCLVKMTPAGDHARLTIALAGHQPPLLIRRSGEATQVGKPGTLLGVVDHMDITESELDLHPGETLLLYTDGVPEAGRAGAQLGEHGLLELCAQAPRFTLEELLRQIERTALDCADGKLRDDIALLAVRLRHSVSS